MYFYTLKNKQNEQAQLLEMCGHAFIVDGIGCNGVNKFQTQILKSVGK